MDRTLRRYSCGEGKEQAGIYAGNTVFSYAVATLAFWSHISATRRTRETYPRHPPTCGQLVRLTRKSSRP